MPNGYSSEIILEQPNTPVSILRVQGGGGKINEKELAIVCFDQKYRLQYVEKGTLKEELLDVKYIDNAEGFKHLKVKYIWVVDPGCFDEGAVHILNDINIQGVTVIFPDTSPLKKVEDVKKAINELEKNTKLKDNWDIK